MILNKARMLIHINVFILTELTLLISNSSFIINLVLDQIFSEGVHLYLVISLLVCGRRNQPSEYIINRSYSNLCRLEWAFCICSCGNFKPKPKPAYKMLGQIFSTSIRWMLDAKTRDWSGTAFISFKSKLSVFLAPFYIPDLALKFLAGILNVVPREI